MARETIMNYRTWIHWLALPVACALCSAALLAAVGQSTTTTAVPKPPDPALAGEKIFQQNCARCHIPPMILNPRITGTVIDHMRVRARLSRKEQKLLLKYLAL
jgi:cytochrome c5